MLFCRKILTDLKKLTEDWLPAEKPTAWMQCPNLSLNELGKSERSKWINWAEKSLGKQLFNNKDQEH